MTQHRSTEDTRGVWKYEVVPQREFYHMMPEGAVVLYVAAQAEYACLWALVDKTKPLVRRDFIMLATGEGIEADMLGRHVGSFIEPENGYLFHVFERKEAKHDEPQKQ